MLASATSERGDCHLGVVDKESPGTEVTGDGRTTLKKDPLTHRVTTKLTDMTFLPPGKPPRADNESRMRIAAKARADGCAKNDGRYFGPGTEHTLLLFLVKLGFSGAPRNKWSGLFFSFVSAHVHSTWKQFPPGACGGLRVLLRVLGIIGRPHERVLIRRRRQHRTHHRN